MTPQQQTIKLSDIKFDPKVYPRQKHDPELVQKYAQDMSSIEASLNFICVAQDLRLIDGRHRHLAYQTLHIDEPDYEIQTLVYPVQEDADVFDLAAELNSASTWQMTEDDKRTTAQRMYRDHGRTQEQIARCLKVSKAKVSSWLSAILQSEKEEREAKIWEMWLSCHTLDEIGASLDITKQAVGQFLQKSQVEYLGNDASLFRNFEPQIYTVWNFGKLTNQAKVFGSIPQEIIDNLLYYYTQPFDVVFDPFGGGGSTIDKCIERKRRYYVSDLSPIPARQDIRQWDITQGLPEDLRVPDFVFLDPPYWKQAEGKYSKAETDLGNVDLDTFTITIGNIARDIKRKWGTSREDARLAIIVGLLKQDGTYIDLPFLCYQAIAKYLTLDVRIQVPYSTQIHGGAYVKMAKENKELLYLSRDLMVFTR